MLRPCALLMVVLVPGVSAGQTPTPETAAPHMVRAAGMPLNDGSLAPGMLTVRIVQGAFTRNLADQVVDVEVVGGKVESGRTGADGRAQFAHLPLGARVRASTTVDGERLESEPFEMPAQSGVRVLLVTGDGAAPSAGQAGPEPAAWTAASLSAGPAAPIAPQPAVPPPADAGVAAIRAALATATVLAFGVMFFGRRARR